MIESIPIRQLYDDFVKGNVAGIFTYLADDVEWETYGSEEFPFTGAAKGHQDLLAFFMRVATHLDIQTNTPVHILKQDNMIVVWGEMRAVVRATGKVVVSPFADLVKAKDGKIVSYERLMNTIAFQ